VYNRRKITPYNYAIIYCIIISYKHLKHILKDIIENLKKPENRLIGK
jgi:hypothetical protein